MPHPVGIHRLTEFGETIFATMSARAQQQGAINLRQGFPDYDGPTAMLDIAREQIAQGNNQYAPALGFPVLREAVGRHQRDYYGMDVDPDTEVLITVGATEALTAAIIGLVEPHEDVIVLEPYFDSYAAAIALAGANRIAVPLAPKDNSWDLDISALRDAITPRTRMIIVNSPHNPTGAIFNEAAIRELCTIANDHDLIVVSDEVYEHMLFDDSTHRPIATYQGMRDRTITVSSAAKTLCVTGWKTGWAIAIQPLITAIQRAKQYLSFVGASPFQPAVAYALDNERQWITNQQRMLEENRNILSTALKHTGFHVSKTLGTFYVVADSCDLSASPATEFCYELISSYNVAAIPISAFTDHPDPWRTKLRFTFGKKRSVIEEAATALTQQLH
ncbi:pyridoxal phosphate-dependent aminotransferase [Corynebacterium belfantii]|uniref:Pyridoxal phosphate-dependent aminotransferase n=1 Tax=Corynebacterium belfantii TaxID=2014537 RepID=A0ABS0LD85_9CORY|nr:pyridoxal phosphate-dependent aminotransferase [Corynebacterium belfantii]MBG9288062.1 pyridoxal phosphate-dependent aminotransferase [Corynebacterium belfantii]MBG9347490.1 pyridoxal phosphate-dependent aminotransferase [Corynebacterium belfantii]MBG9354641.1 pyridoxal phosphate-dependent aminotransferase [Corynebacterium belfantii]